MFLEERRQQILEYLDKNERVKVEVLASLFAVTRETIRSDLNALAAEKLVQRCHGGAMVIRRSLQSKLIADTGGNFEVLLQRLQSQKRKQSVQQGKGKNMKGKVCILGSFNVDIVAKVERFPKGGESLLALGSTLGPGGKGANQATAVSRAGARVHFVSKVGKDQFSQFAYDHLTSSEIHSFTLYQSDTEPTGNAIIYVSQENGENMIAIYSGANKTISEDEVAAIAPELEDSDVLLVQLENNFAATLSAMKLAKALGVKVILNPAPFSSHALECLEYVDVITPNETEASQLSGIDVKDLASAKEAAQRIVSQGARRVIITMGSRGALLFDGNQFQHIPAFPALSVDTTGAGDAFNGALASSIANGQSLVQAATYAAAFASLAVEREGASNMPDKAQVSARLAQR
ncbi:MULTISPECIES: ribokinase [Rahnella]|jgi:ribokinase|uniref:Ribokinase n=1 Tax=Rahnella sp. (strain Y9602) TaxID=2703885 RepID=A0A0H3FDL0_RAHSY|nr:MULTISPECIES: ribokinase [Rahnella]AFE59815.1 ribokinase [Rahnella aquatilis HX2]AYA08487.1 ribokinase [Rahnella aquatilis]ADW75166.1 ribokinase [Rahnella aceris]AZP43585.1 ribokinase [Rahnella aquatilis]AZP47922.1 ribokinase [Rahnella aquatilis]